MNLYDDELEDLEGAFDFETDGSSKLFFIQKVSQKKYGDPVAKVQLIEV